MDRVILSFPGPEEFQAWLEENHSSAPGVWLRIAKKGSEERSITYPEALEWALCYGWIDGQKVKHDDASWLQSFSRRKSNSLWSQVNQGHVARLTVEGRMRPSGFAAVEAAKQSGRWDSAYQPTRSREIPSELAEALASSPKAREFFETLGSQNRFAFVFRSSSTKKAETRIKRAQEFVRMMERGEVFYPKK